MINKEYLFSIYIVTLLLVIFSIDNEIFAQIAYNNDTLADIPFTNTTHDSEEDRTVEYYNDGSMDSQAFNDSMNKMDDFFSGNIDNYPQQQFNEDNNNILSEFGKSLSNSIFNDTSIFGVLGYSLIDNVKVIGAQVIDNNSINVTLEYNNNNNSFTSPSVTVVAHKLDINISDLFSFLPSALAGGEDMMMIPSNDVLPFNNNNIPIFDMISNFKIGSNVAESGWSSPHNITIKVKNGGFEQNESDTSIILIELIPKE
jgi:hypothetical protein